jgi:hypothetical protein
MPSSARYQKGKVCTSQQQIVTYICLCPKQTVLPVIPLLNGLKGDQNQAIRQHERTAVHQDWLKNGSADSAATETQGQRLARLSSYKSTGEDPKVVNKGDAGPNPLFLQLMISLNLPDEIVNTITNEELSLTYVGRYLARDHLCSIMDKDPASHTIQTAVHKLCFRVAASRRQSLYEALELDLSMSKALNGGLLPYAVHEHALTSSSLVWAFCVFNVQEVAGLDQGWLLDQWQELLTDCGASESEMGLEGYIFGRSRVKRTAEGEKQVMRVHSRFAVKLSSLLSIVSLFVYVLDSLRPLALPETWGNRVGIHAPINRSGKLPIRNGVDNPGDPVDKLSEELAKTSVLCDESHESVNFKLPVEQMPSERIPVIVPVKLRGKNGNWCDGRIHWEIRDDPFHPAIVRVRTMIRAVNANWFSLRVTHMRMFKRSTVTVMEVYIAGMFAPYCETCKSLKRFEVRGDEAYEVCKCDNKVVKGKTIVSCYGKPATKLRQTLLVMSTSSVENLGDTAEHEVTKVMWRLMQLYCPERRLQLMKWAKDDGNKWAKRELENPTPVSSGDTMTVAEVDLMKAGIEAWRVAMENPTEPDHLYPLIRHIMGEQARYDREIEARKAKRKLDWEEKVETKRRRVAETEEQKEAGPERQREAGPEEQKEAEEQKTVLPDRDPATGYGTAEALDRKPWEIMSEQAMPDIIRLWRGVRRTTKVSLGRFTAVLQRRYTWWLRSASPCDWVEYEEICQDNDLKGGPGEEAWFDLFRTWYNFEC